MRANQTWERASLALLLVTVSAATSGRAQAQPAAREFRGPAIIDAERAFTGKGLPRNAGILRFSQATWDKITRDIPVVEGPIPRDCGGLLVFPLPKVVPAGDDISLTPTGDIGVTPLCQSQDMNYACVPIMRVVPGQGMVLVSCQCIRVGDSDDGSSDAPVITFPTIRYSCQLSISATGISCNGRCARAGESCQLAFWHTAAIASRPSTSRILGALGCRCAPRRGT